MPSEEPVASFRTTRWSLVGATARAHPAQSRAALHELCQLYWRPLYGFLRRDGYRQEEAMDGVQGFLTELLDGGSVAGAEPGKGRFRSYLLGALKHYLKNQERAAAAAKRGGGQATVSLDVSAAEAESVYAADLVSGEAADQAFDREFALAVLDEGLRKLESWYESRNRAAVFARLREYLARAPEPGEYGRVAAELKLSETAVKVAVHRMRSRMREILSAAMHDAIEDPGAVAVEWSALMEGFQVSGGGL